MIAHLTPHFWITAAFVILLAFAGGCCVGAAWAMRNAWTEPEPPEWMRDVAKGKDDEELKT